MPHEANVTIQYGPYGGFCGVVEHRTSRLEGMKKILEKNKHQVAFERIEDRNRVNLIVNGENVFTCCLDDLEFGGDGLLDSLCLEAADKVLLAY